MLKAVPRPEEPEEEVEEREQSVPPPLPAAIAPRRGPTTIAPPRQAPPPLPAPFFVIIFALLGLSGLALWAAFYGTVLSAVQEHRSQHELWAVFRSQLVDGTAPTGGKIRQGVPVAMMQIPPLGIRNLMVVEGTTSGDLKAGPGHRRDTPLPGETGASFILGRSFTFGAPFDRIVRLKKGAPITVDTEEGTFKFVVDAVRRPGDSLTPLDPSAARLTLVTSEATKGGRQAVYVDATTKDNVQPAPSDLPPSVRMAEKQMQGDTQVLPSVIVWLVGVGAVLVAAAWARARWGLLPTLLVGIPVLIAAVWGLSETVSEILPNLF